MFEKFWPLLIYEQVKAPSLTIIIKEVLLLLKGQWQKFLFGLLQCLQGTEQVVMLSSNSKEKVYNSDSESWNSCVIQLQKVHAEKTTLLKSAWYHEISSLASW